MKQCKHSRCENPVREKTLECLSCNSLRKRYGITTPERDSILEEQDFECKLCGSHIEFNGPAATKHTAAVDHCHKFGHIRGILCGSCNTGLGKFCDSADLLIRAANYLEENK